MMNKLHKATSSFMLKIIVLIIIVSFILTHMSSYLFNNDTNYVAKINNQIIDRHQFENLFTKELNYLYQKLGEEYLEFSSNKEHINHLRQQLLNQLIKKILIDQYARRLKLDISDEQIKKAILSVQAFQANNEYYASIMNKLGVTAHQYVQMLRDQLKTQQLIQAINNTDFLLKEEVDELIALIFQQRIIRKAVIDIRSLADKQRVSKEEINHFYEENRNAFISPEKFKVNYIKLDAAKIEENVLYSEIISYYKNNKREFMQPQRSRYRIIQTDFEDDAKILLNKLKKGADFSTLAKIKSKDLLSAKRGGDIGWVEDAFVPDELKKAGLKERKQLSNVIKSSVGYIIARLDDIQPAKIKSFSEVFNEIKAKIKKQKALNKFNEIKLKVSNVINNDEQSFIRIEKIIGLKSIKTNWFSLENLPKELNFKPSINTIISNNLVKIANSSEKTINSKIFIASDDNILCVLCVTDYKSKNRRPLSEIKDQIINLIKNKKAMDRANLDVSTILIELKKSKNENETLKKIGLNFSMPETVNRIEDNAISEKVFSMKKPKKNKTNYDVINDEKNNIIILALDKVKKGDISEMQKGMITQNIDQNNKEIIFEALTENLRRRSKIRMGSLTIER